ncbi:MAG: TonB-dependent receptor [Bacteroidales bacterium]
MKKKDSCAHAGLKKFLFIMKLFLILNLCFTVTLAASTYSQNNSLSVNFKNTKIKDVFKSIEDQSTYRFFYNDELSDVNRSVDLSMNEKNIDEILNLLFKDSEISYTILENNLIVIAPKRSLQLFTVAGKVTDAATGQPLPGVNISVKGTSNGTITDFEGTYKIELENSNSVLSFSYMGYKVQEVEVAGKNKIDIQLETSEENIEEVVVIGYGTQKKRDVTGSVSSVKGDELVKLPSMRADQALQGKAAGVVVTNTDGAPGGNTTIRVRGSNSITGSNAALVVIDGYQGGNLSTVNPNEIESIEVLKDASATSIYGSRGANGVILVTTKKGKLGKPMIDYSYNFGVQKISNKIDLMSAGEYAQKSNDWRATQNGTPGNPITPTLPFTQQEIDDLYQTGGTDWQDEIYRTAKLQMHQLSVSGGTDKAKYFAAGGYFDQEGLIVNTKFKRFTLRTNIDVDVTKWFKTGLNINLVKDKGNVPAFGEGTRYVDILGQVVNSVLRFDPITPVKDELGNYSRGPATYGDPDVWNPAATAYGTYDEKNDFTTNFNSYFDFRIANGLNFRITGAAGLNNTSRRTYYSHITQNGNQSDGVGQIAADNTYYFQNSNILTYDKVFASAHHLTITGVGETQLLRSYGNFIDAQGFFSDATGINDLGQANQINTKTSYDTERVINSYMGRVNYGFAEKYLFTFSYRADGASVFGSNNKWGYFPSASLAWRASEEDFIKILNVFSDLKFRGSWGKTGNQAISPYATLDVIASGYNYPYNGTGATDIGFAAVTAANPNLKWETTTQTNFGVDMGFFNNRLVATFDVYKKATDDLLLQRPVPNYTGYTVLLDNVGSVENKGLEISIGGDPFVKEFKWNTSFNISFNRSKVIALLDGQKFMPIRTNSGGGYQFWANGANNALMNLEVDEPFGHMRGYVCLGTWGDNEADSAAVYGQLPGDQKYLDVNGDHQITQADLTKIGNTSPKFVFGWSNNMSYKSFTLSFLFQGSYGNDIFNATRIKLEDPRIGLSPALMDRWTTDNQDTDVPAFTTTMDRADANLTSRVKLGSSAYNRLSRWVEDGSYIRLKSITLGYNLPSGIIDKIGLTNFRAFVTATNVFTLSKYTGYDPEVSSYNVAGDAARGIDLSNYPTVKTLTFGVNLTF